MNTLNKLVSNEKGQALPAVLICLVLGGLTLAPLLSHMSAGLNSTRIHHERMVEQYSGDSAIEHATCRLLYDSQFVESMTPGSPSAQYSININGMEVPVTVTRLSGLGGDTLDLDDVDYIIPAGHLLELKVIVLADDHCHFAYDSVGYNSWLSIPTTPETTYYLHNNPTPPTSDTDMQADLPMDESPSTAVTLYNYDQDYDLSPGRKVEERSVEGPDGLDLKEYQNWRTTPYTTDTHLNGTVLISLWVAPDGFNYENEGEFWLFLRDYDPDSQTYAEIASDDFLIEEGEWIAEGWTPTAPEGKYKILASAGNTHIEAVVALGFGYLRILSFMYKDGE